MTFVVGIDLGTSGARAVAMNGAGAVVASGTSSLSDHGGNGRSAKVWWSAVETALRRLLAQVSPTDIVALSVDGTSGTMLAIDRNGEPLADGMMYSDPVRDEAILGAIRANAPDTSAAHGPTSGLAKLMALMPLSPWKVVHQADWIAGRLSGRFDLSDENNALKTGYDPVLRDWPDWIAATPADRALLPDVGVPGTVTGRISAETAAALGLPPQTLIVAGTTDGCASFLATGAAAPGDGVTALGSSLTVKVLSDKPIFAPRFGLYSHRLGDRWLAGGASNTGGKVLLHFFDPARIQALSEAMDVQTPTGLDYYPLLSPGERFPTADPHLQPRLDPRPDDDATFLQGLFEGIAAVEAQAYARLAELGGPALASVRSVGGGARNPVWTDLRQQVLGVPFLAALSDEAAAGTARLALQGARADGAIP
jgi:sugar (pentulose or hexulose) kinase